MSAVIPRSGLAAMYSRSTAQSSTRRTRWQTSRPVSARSNHTGSSTSINRERVSSSNGTFPIWCGLTSPDFPMIWRSRVCYQFSLLLSLLNGCRAWTCSAPSRNVGIAAGAGSAAVRGAASLSDGLCPCCNAT